MSNVMLERPELLRKSIYQPFAERLRSIMLNYAREADTSSFQPNITVLVRTKNDETGLMRIIQNIRRQQQHYKGRIDLIVVDTESTDKTTTIAREFGAIVVPITQDEFDYPMSINRGMSVVKDDSLATFITVGHALPAMSNCLQAAARHFEDDKVTGVYGGAIPHENVSRLEKLLFTNTAKARLGAHRIEEFGMGVLGATNCMVRTDTWRSRPFDAAFAAGGEDAEWARVGLANGEVIVYDPAVNVHHSHGLGPVNLLRQFIHWHQVASGPQDFSNAAISARRPDLFES